jgi:hypothetical protein
VKQRETDLKDLRDLRVAKSKEVDATTMSLRELNQAIERNGSKPLIPWSKAKKELG